ncbi:PREDICTED: uncharacterized protein LOC109159944 [Ipomoea nil]|uniref:uncharacterized protein LOC109159944 n=1 Tax=Ipomoea nil TaxID=35883 RepID=UPI0009014232|nr:PREDICTED: uncharacterized protein LOC109159944 [Ipomoea nil]
MATNRSPEEQDLLERSTRRAKRGRASTDINFQFPPDSGLMETSVGQRTSTPDSAQGRSPAATPSNPWNRRPSQPATEDKADSDDDEMEANGKTYDYPVILVTKEEKERLRRPWRRSLILRVLGRTVGYSFLLQRLQRMWRTEVGFELIALTHDYFIAKFEYLADYDAAKYGGPWMVLDHYLVTQQWRPNFDPRNSKLDKLLAWICFPSLPIEYFDDDFLKKIGKVIGRPIKIDVTSGLASKGKFAKVCAELDISKPLLSNFVINGTEWPIEYEGIHQICFKCGIYSHRMEHCGEDASLPVDSGVDVTMANPTPDPVTPILADFENTFKEVPPDEVDDPALEPTHVVAMLDDTGQCDPMCCLGIAKVSENSLAPWVMSAVYGSPNMSLRKRLFTDLSGQFFHPQAPWLTVGDFNSVTNREEVSSTSTFSASRCSDFNDWIYREGLIDLGYSGSTYTWIRGMDTPSFKGARLDRALCSTDWSLLFPGANVRHLPMLGSDHSPLLISTANGSPHQRISRFKFNLAWASHYSFQRKKHLLGRLKGVQRSLSRGPRLDLLRLNRRLRKELDETLYQEELSWFQRSREEWIKSGDRNTRFYQLATSIKQSHSKIPHLRGVDDLVICEDALLLKHVHDFYLDLYSADNGTSLQNLQHGCFPHLPNEDWHTVNLPICVEEVKTALFDMAPCKAPGPDGFTAAFFQRTWSSTGGCLVKFTMHFFEHGILPPGCNDTILSLIPNVQNPEYIKQFRPIGLCNVAYKLITKIMATRLKDIAGKLVGPHQSSFIQGRQIIDNSLAYQEVLNSFRTKKGKTGWMALKIDLEKAFDRLSWSFIEDTLRDIGFNQSWIRNIMHCITSSRLAVFWNGHLTDWFAPEKGIRQGDPISPLLFVLCIERLSHIVQNSVNHGTWKGVRISHNAPNMSHLFFADDLVFFGEATMQQASEILRCLELFCSCSGQKINNTKSSLFFSKNVDPSISQQISQALGISTVPDMGIHLGLPTIHGRFNKDLFKGILEKIQNRLAGWKSKTLSLAGRHIMIQSVLTAIPYYSMQTMPFPLGVIEAIEKIIRSFLWGAKDGIRKCYLVNWDTVTKRKDNGGLGIKNLKHMNLAFLAKLAWRLYQDEDCLWIKLFKARYGLVPTDWTSWLPHTNSSIAWRCILQSLPFVRKGLKWHVRNGVSTRFWLDIWLDDRPLLECITAQIAPSSLNNYVTDYWIPDEGWNWDLLDQLLPVSLLNKLSTFILQQDSLLNDQIVWHKEPNGSFSVSSAYDTISNPPIDVEASRWNAIWKLKIPSRICFFLWLVRHNKIMTNLCRTQRKLTNDDSCWTCVGTPEDTNHVLRFCPAAEAIWTAILPEFHDKTKHLPLVPWLDKGVAAKGNGRRPVSDNITFAVTLWWVWKWRNEAIFKNLVKPLSVKVQQIRTHIEDINNSFARCMNPIPTVDQSWKMLTWKKPPPGTLKLNIDGSVAPLSLTAGCGGVIRNSSGEWITGFIAKLGTCTPLEAEAWSILKGIQFAIAKGYSNVLIESDSSDVVNFLQDSRPSCIAAHNILEACKKELRRLNHWQVSAINREQNYVADALAKMAINHDFGLLSLTDPPDEITTLLDNDRDSLPVWRITMNSL